MNRKKYDNSGNNNEIYIYTSMTRMSGNDESLGKYFGDSLQLTNWVLDSGATFHMTP